MAHNPRQGTVRMTVFMMLHHVVGDQVLDRLLIAADLVSDDFIG